MANEKNLKPVKTKSEARERGRNGGIASGQARREKRTIQQILKTITDGDTTTLSQFTSIAQKLGLESGKSIKEVYSIIALLNSVKTANLGDLERLQRLMGEQVDEIGSDEERQVKAHNELIEALRDRRANED